MSARKRLICTGLGKNPGNTDGNASTNVLLHRDVCSALANRRRPLPSDPDERSLLSALAKGDKGAFEQVYLTHKDNLMTIAAHAMGDSEGAADVVHDVFVSLVRRSGRLRLRGGLRGYLIASCMNRARDVLRRRRTRQQASGIDSNPRPSGLGPQEVAEIAEETARVLKAVALLPPEQREVVSLRIHGELKFREIASLLRISKNTAKSRYRYALSALRKALAAGKELSHEHGM